MEAVVAHGGDSAATQVGVPVCGDGALMVKVPFEKGDSKGSHRAYVRVKDWLANRTTWEDQRELVSAVRALCPWMLGGERIGGKEIMQQCEGKTEEEACAWLVGLGVAPAAAAKIARVNVPPSGLATSPGTVSKATAAKAKRKRDAAADPPAPAASPATGVPLSVTDAAAQRLGRCGYCACGTLPECWKPVVDDCPACDDCYASDSTRGAKRVAMVCDTTVRVISVAAPDGHPATLEAGIVEAIERWDLLRQQHDQHRHLVMAGRVQLQIDRQWATKTAAQRNDSFTKRVGGNMAQLTTASDLYDKLADGAFHLFDLHRDTIGSMYDTLFPRYAVGPLRFYAIEYVHVKGPAKKQFVHNKRVLAGYMQLAVFLTDAPQATVHVRWRQGLEDAAGQVTSLRLNVVGNDGLLEADFEAELSLDGDLAAIAAATTRAELEQVGERVMFPHPIRAGHLQAFSHDVNHYGGEVQAGKPRTLLVALVSRGHDGNAKDIEAKQEHGALKPGHLGLFATTFASQRLQEQLRTEFLSLQGPTSWGVHSATVWKGMLNPKFDPATACAPGGQSTLVETTAAVTTGTRRAIAELGDSRNTAPVDLGWVKRHSRGMVHVSSRANPALAAVGIHSGMRYVLQPGAEKKVHFTGAYATERGKVMQGQLTIVCEDTGEKVAITKGQVVEIRRGMRCVLKNEGKAVLRKSYGVFDKHGHQLKEHDADEEELLAELTCDACGKDVWWESFKVGTGDDAKDYCAACLADEEKCTREARDCAKRHVFDEDATM